MSLDEAFSSILAYLLVSLTSLSLVTKLYKSSMMQHFVFHVFPVTHHFTHFSVSAVM